MPVWKEEKKEGGGSFLSYRTVQYLTLLSVWWSHPKRIVIKREKNLIRHRVRVNKKVLFRYLLSWNVRYNTIVAR